MMWAIGVDPGLARTAVFAIGLGGPGEKDALLWEQFTSVPKETSGLRDRFFRYGELVGRVRSWIEQTCGKFEQGTVAQSGRKGAGAIEPAGVKIACIENYAFLAKWSSRACMELGACYRSMLLQTCHEVVEVAPTQLKAFATKHGKAGKKEVKERVEGEFGITLPNEDVSDACACAWVAAVTGGMLGAGFDLQSEIVKKVAETV